MKKIILILICILILPFSVFSQENVDATEDTVNEDPFYDDIDFFDENLPLWIKDRKFEIGFLNMNVGLSNDFLSTNEIFKETLVLDLDKLGRGFNANMNMFFNPLFFNYNNDNLWGFGLSTGFSFSGDLSLSGDMLHFRETKNSKSEIVLAIFAEVNAPVFFHIDKFKIKITPSIYYTLIYTKSDIRYTYYNTDINGEKMTIFKLEIDPVVYSSFSLDEFNGLTANPGMDFYLGAEYPLSEVLDLTNIHPLLNFNVGLDLYGVPFFSSSMDDYMRMPIVIGSDEPINFFDMDEDNSFISEGETEYGRKKRSVFRPFKMHAWADWYPLGSEFLTVTPLLGFAVNPIFNNPASFEWSLKGGINLANMFRPSIKIGYYDRLWKNDLDLILNFRAVQLNLGLGLQAPSFAKSWSGGGFSFNFGLIFGW